MDVFNTFLVSLLVFSTFLNVQGCNDYKLKVTRVRNCDDNGVMKVQNGTATLDANCILIPRGCLSITKPFKTATVNYRIKKAPMPDITGSNDMCKELQNSKMKTMQFLTSTGLKCPGEVKTICNGARKRIDLNKYKNQISVAAGKVELRLDIIHDTGKSCLDIAFELHK